MQINRLFIFLLGYFIHILSLQANDTIFYFSESKIHLNSDIEIFRDSTNELLLAEIIDQRLFEDAIRFDKNKFAIKFSNDNYWFHFKLVNKNAYLKELIFEVANPTLDFIQLYTVNNGLIRHTKPTGDEYNFSTRQIQSRNFAYKLVIEPEETYEIYLNINCKSEAAKIPMYLYAQSAFTKKVQIENIIFGFFYGIVLAIVIVLILSLLFKHKRRSLTFLISYIVFVVLLLLNIDGLGFQFLYPNIPWLANHLDIISPVIAIFFIHNFVFHYVNLSSISKRYYNISNIFNYSILLILPLLIFNLINVRFLIITLLIIASVSLIFIVYILMYNYKFYPIESRIITLSFLSLFIVIIGFYLRIFTYSQNFILESILIKAGFLIQFMILTFALIVNLKVLQDKTQKEAISNLMKLNELKEKSNRELDKVLKEKTKSLYEINQKFKKAIIQNSNITTSLHQQKIEITKQKEHIENTNEELEVALKEISNKNKQLEQKNEEIESQKDEIIAQKNIIESRNRDITDSINYAQRIQSALFQSEQYIKTYVKDAFVFYQPKEIIGGDLYWFEEFPSKKYMKLSGKEHDKKFIIAAIDCTGHGVPGALMSIVARDLLDKAINEKGYTVPAEIINDMHHGIIHTLRKGTEIGQISDGMDMTLCTIDRKSLMLQFAGAINPIIIIRNGQIVEIRGNRFSVGTYLKEKTLEFTNHEYQLEKGDAIYLFTDGYSDQFGGDDLKKFKYKNFKTLLLEIVDKPFTIQRKILVERFNKWKNNVEQIDDVLVIGLKID